MSARVWTVEELDLVHHEVKRKGWTWALDDGRPFAHLGPIDQVGTITVRVDEYRDGVREICCERVVFAQDWPDDTVREDPDIDVALAVILASQGRDSLEAMAEALDTQALGTRSLGRSRGLRESAAMLRSGTVKP